MSRRAVVGILGTIGGLAVIAWALHDSGGRADTTVMPESLPGLRAPVRVVRDIDGVPHIFAADDHDGHFMLGFLHAQDRLFQMDHSRRFFSGTLSELLGAEALPSDIQLRTLGLRRAAEASVQAYAASTRVLLQAYADGVNAYLAQGTGLPPEYAALELTTIPEWTLVDTLTVAKGLAFGLSFDLDDIARTLALQAYQEAGGAAQFDGTALFFEDVFRTAPFDAALSIPLPPPASLQGRSQQPHGRRHVTDVGRVLAPGALRAARAWSKKMEAAPELRRLFSASRRAAGSNWWVVSGALTDSGRPYLANDPHLSLEIPSTFYEAHLTVRDDPMSGAMNVNGVTFPGTPSFVQGCNDSLCWGSTVNPLDVTDIFQETLVLQAGLPTGTLFDGVAEPLVFIGQVFRVNQIGNAVLDDLTQAPVSILAGGVTLIVPRRNNGPIISLDLSQPNPTALSVQYTGWGPTRQAEAFLRFARAADVEAFREALQFFDVGSQNWVVASVDGDIAYFTSAEMPLREDLQSGVIDGDLPPFFIRDGTHALRHEWLPLQNPQSPQALAFEVLPFDEMPQVVNPPAGWIASANNDPVGTSLDNNPVNQLRDGGGILYLSPGYTSLRIGRIDSLIRDVVEIQARPFTFDDLARIQRDHHLLDAEILVPYILRAFANATSPGMSAPLASLGADPSVAEAVGRLTAWDLTTPTGIAEGFDPGDDPSDLPQPTQKEIDASVAAAIYSMWRSRIVTAVIDGTLERIGVGGHLPDEERALSALRRLLDDFDVDQGIGASGVDFFAVDEIEDRAQARDFRILNALAQALVAFSGDEFAAAFGNSPLLGDYRWGRLHRLVLGHPLGAPFSVPPGGGFSDLSPGLVGLARSGGWETVDASAHSMRANSLSDFRFDSGPARRFLAEMTPEIRAFQIIPGGQSGLVDSPDYAGQLGRWLTHQVHPLRLSPVQVEGALASERILAPPDQGLFFPFVRSDSEEFTGFAAASLLDVPTQLTFSGFDQEGQLLDLPSNPTVVALDGRAQQAVLAGDLFSPGVQAALPDSTWVRAAFKSDEVSLDPFLASFTLFGDFGLSRLDGSVAAQAPSASFVFTRVHQGPAGFRGHSSRTQISLANPSEQEIEVRLTLTGEAGVSLIAPPSTVFRTIAPRGLLRADVADLFGAPQVTKGIIRGEVIRGPGVVGLLRIEFPDTSSLAALNASPGSAAAPAFSAQFASGAEIFTDVSVVNSDVFTRRITMTAVPEGNAPVPDPVSFDLAAGDFRQMDAAEVFPDLAAEFVGTLEVSADGPGVIGDVLFGRPSDLSFAAALPLDTRRFRQAVFGHVANIAGVFFTGLALYNPGDQPTSVTIQVFTAQGQANGAGQLVLQPKERLSRLLGELIPASTEQTGGFIVVTSVRPIIAQEIFGAGLNLQAAVPPTVIE